MPYTCIPIATAADYMHSNCTFTIHRGHQQKVRTRTHPEFNGIQNTEGHASGERHKKIGAEGTKYKHHS